MRNLHPLIDDINYLKYDSTKIDYKLEAPQKLWYLYSLYTHFYLEQTHGVVKDDVLEVKGRGALLHFDDFDAMVTNQQGVGLLIRHADCQAATFYDPVSKAIGNVHSGWRGSKLNIYKKVTNTMGKLYGTNG